MSDFIKSEYYHKMLNELDKFERLSLQFKDELRIISISIRNDIWNEHNSETLYKILTVLNYFYSLIPIDLDSIKMYISQLSTFSIYYSSKDLREYYLNLYDKIRTLNAKKIIDEQWKDISHGDQGCKSMHEIFDDLYTNYMEKYPEKFFVTPTVSDYLYRACDVLTNDPNRFVPWPNKTFNRWNPPGKTYLYLSYGKENTKFENSELSIDQYICLLEIRAKKNKEYSLCRFRPRKKLKVIDLSYNDISLHSLEEPIQLFQETAQQKVNESFLYPVLNNKKKMEFYKSNPKIAKSDVKTAVEGSLKGINLVLIESFIKQCLKMICDSIFKPIDDEGDHEAQYKSFHDLAGYLESKRIDGIIYPSTRIMQTRLSGKCMVLFDVNCASPISDSIFSVTF